MARTAAALLICMTVIAGFTAADALALPTVEDSPSAQKLDQLFSNLKTAQGIAQRSEIEQQIVAIWLKSGDPAVDQQMRYAMTAMGLNALDRALESLDIVVLTKPDYAEGWNKRATVYFMLGRYQDSLADIKTTLELEPRHFGALAGRGMIMLQLDDKEKALEAFKQAVAIDPNLTNLQAQIRALEQELHSSAGG